jgi:hypothetical protein
MASQPLLEAPSNLGGNGGKLFRKNVQVLDYFSFPVSFVRSKVLNPVSFDAIVISIRDKKYAVELIHNSVMQS